MLLSRSFSHCDLVPRPTVKIWRNFKKYAYYTYYKKQSTRHCDLVIGLCLSLKFVEINNKFACYVCINIYTFVRMHAYV